MGSHSLSTRCTFQKGPLFHSDYQGSLDNPNGTVGNGIAQSAKVEFAKLSCNLRVHHCGGGPANHHFVEIPIVTADRFSVYRDECQTKNPIKEWAILECTPSMYIGSQQDPCG